MKQSTHSNPMAQAFACACFACAGLAAVALNVSLGVLFVLVVALSIALLGMIRLVRRTDAYAC